MPRPGNGASPSARIASAWRKLAPLPGGKRVFSRFLGFMVPYTGSIRPYVKVFEPGHAVVVMRDRRAVRNHLNSIHAVALMNLGEVTSGLALITALPPDYRSIVTGLSIEFFRKARGTLTAESRNDLHGVEGDTGIEVFADISDRSGEVVARVTARWRIGPA